MFTTYFKMERLSDFENLMKRNELEFMTSIKYDWEYTSTNNKDKEKEIDMNPIYYQLFTEDFIVISNGNNIIFYDFVEKIIKLYHKTNSKDILFNGNVKKIIESFNKLGLLLQNRFKAEEKTVQNAINPRSKLYYEE